MNSIIETKDLKLWYGDHQVLKGITMDIPEHQITALIGPSGCGKSTFLKTLNRMNDLVENVRITGEVKYICNITIYLAYPSVIQKRYDINISNGQIGMSPAYSFNCYDIKSIFNLIHHSKANIYVTKSFLLFNNWTINRFCKEYNISMEMVQLINDGN